MGRVRVYGIGNPLMDVLAEVEEAELRELALKKGTMALIDDETGENILRFLGDRDRTYQSGGSCPNTINTLAALGVAASLSGCVGMDELGAKYTERLLDDGVVSDVTARAGVTGTSIILVTPDAERTMGTRRKTLIIGWWRKRIFSISPVTCGTRNHKRPLSPRRWRLPAERRRQSSSTWRIPWRLTGTGRIFSF
ncbi:MAG: hypothetical protein EA427_16755 [Spirochaetaceae bacterium]|nr:MAG: hypothetical protein EA427_16755 [Spirochaetaceae bacterium]